MEFGKYYYKNLFKKTNCTALHLYLLTERKPSLALLATFPCHKPCKGGITSPIVVTLSFRLGPLDPPHVRLHRSIRQIQGQNTDPGYKVIGEQSLGQGIRQSFKWKEQCISILGRMGQMCFNNWLRKLNESTHKVIRNCISHENELVVSLHCS